MLRQKQYRMRRFEDVVIAERYRNWVFEQHERERAMNTTMQSNTEMAAEVHRQNVLDSCDCLHSILQAKCTNRAIPADINPLLADLRLVNDLREKLSEIDGELSKRKEKIERGLLDYHERTDLESVRGGGMSVSFSPSLRPRVDPEKWDELFSWAVATGNTQCLYKQTSTAKLLECVTGGEAVPLGVTVESYVKINARRV